MRVIISFQDKFTSITIPEDAIAACKRYIGQEAEITLEQYLETLERDGKIYFESEKTGRKVTITRIGKAE